MRLQPWAWGAAAAIVAVGAVSFARRGACIEMTDRNEHVYRFLSFGCGGFVGARRRMDVEGWYIRQGVIVEDLVERGLVIAAEKHIMMRDLWILLVHAPVEHDRRAGVKFVFELAGFLIFGEQFLIDIRKVCIADENIRS